MKRLSLRIPKSLDAALAAEARRRGSTKSAVMRDALERLIRELPAKARPSCFDLVRDLAGCVEGGPSDLSTNKKHMEGFGQ